MSRHPGPWADQLARAVHMSPSGFHALVLGVFIVLAAGELARLGKRATSDEPGSALPVLIVIGVVLLGAAVYLTSFRTA